MWTALLIAPLASADTFSTLDGEMCDAAGGCTPYAMELHADGVLFDSLGRRGTYTLTAGSAGGRVLGYDFPEDRHSGSMTEDTEGCWIDAAPPLNPQLGQINVCLAVEDLALVRPYDPTCEIGPLFTTGPAEGEAGHWAAGRLTPEQPGGMWVHEVQYYMVAGVGNCGKLDHRVQVFLGADGAAPAATPTVLFDLQVDGPTLPTGQLLRQVTLPDPVFVADGQSLFVSVEQPEDGSGQMCEAVCTAGPLVGDQSYWSNAVLPPYAWQDLNDWQIPELMVRGRVLYANP